MLTGASHLTQHERDKLPDRIREYLKVMAELEDVQAKLKEIVAPLAMDLGRGMFVINWIGGKLIESDGETLKIVHSNVQIHE